MKSRVLTEEKRKQLYKALEDGISITYAANLIGVGKSTIYDHMKANEDFRIEVEIAQAKAIKGLVALVRKQKGGAWKLLKSLGKEDYKDHHEVTNVEKEPIKIVVEEYISKDNKEKEND